MGVFEKQIVISGFECDFRGCMKYSALLQQTQQISREQSDAMGLTLDIHHETHTAFLINDSKATVYHQLHPYETVTIRTQPFAPKRASFYRKTEFFRNGVLCAEVGTNWIMVDTLERKILKEYDDRISDFFPTEEFFAPKHKIYRLPVSPAGVFLASYSFIDENNHVNNANYADLVCNCTPMDRPVSSLLIRYQRECCLQESISLFSGGEQDLWYVIGTKSEGRKSFEANLWFA